MNNQNSLPKLQHKLKARHLSLISLGGSIGTGLFMTSGMMVAQSGPGGSLLAYVLIGAMVYFLMTSMGEMATFLPVPGSFATYAKRFVSPSFGFTVGWNYWYNGVTTLAFAVLAGAELMKFWFPQIPAWPWALLFLLIILAVNAINVLGYGESEFYLAGIKVIAVVAFLIAGVVVIVKSQFSSAASQTYGMLANWTVGDAPFVGGLAGVMGVFIIAGFSFHGTEIVAVAAGESENPRRDVPKAIKTVFWRVLIFYVLTISVIATILPYNDPELMIDGDISASPFTLVFGKIGIPFAASLMNAVILTAVLSVGNGVTYASTRILFGMAEQGDAPKIFSTVSKRGVPTFALALTFAVGCLALLSGVFAESLVYTWLLNLSALTGFFNWVAIALSHYRFRKGYLQQGRKLTDLPYTAKFFPLGPILALIVCAVVILGQDYSAFFTGELDFQRILVTYVGVPVFFLIWLIRKIITKSKFVKYDNMDFVSE